MSTTELRSEVMSYLSDAVAMKGNLDQMLRSMISTSADEQMRGRLESHLDETHTHKTRSEGRLGVYGDWASTLKEMTASHPETGFEGERRPLPDPMPGPARVPEPTPPAIPEPLPPPTPEPSPPVVPEPVPPVIPEPMPPVEPEPGPI